MLNGRNSLSEQSRKALEEENNDGAYIWEAFVANSKQEDGWGVAAYSAANRENPFIRKSAIPAHKDGQFVDTAAELGRQKIDTLLVHIRQGPNRDLTNNHPFRLGAWSFMHNGDIPEHARSVIDTNARDYARRFDQPLPKGTTDTERVFYYLMGQMQQTFGTRNPKDIPTRQLMDFYKTNVRTILGLADSLDDPWLAQPRDRFERLTGVKLKTSSRLHIPVGANFILTDGNRLLATCSGRRLHLGVRNTPGGKHEVLIATQPFQPKPGRMARIQWWEVPDNHMLLLDRQNGEVEVALEPLLPKASS